MLNKYYPFGMLTLANSLTEVIAELQNLSLVCFDLLRRGNTSQFMCMVQSSSLMFKIIEGGNITLSSFGLLLLSYCFYFLISLWGLLTHKLPKKESNQWHL